MEIRGLSKDELDALTQEAARRADANASAAKDLTAAHDVALARHTEFMQANPAGTTEEFPAPAAPELPPVTADDALAAMMRDAFAPVLAAIADQRRAKRVGKFQELDEAAQDALLASVMK